MLHVYPSIKLPTRPSQLPWDHFYPIYAENNVFTLKSCKKWFIAPGNPPKSKFLIFFLP